MGKTIVIYNSQTGFTKKYAEWISDALKCDIAEVSKVKIVDLSEYDNLRQYRTKIVRQMRSQIFRQIV